MSGVGRWSCKKVMQQSYHWQDIPLIISVVSVNVCKVDVYRIYTNIWRIQNGWIISLYLEILI